MVWRQAKALRSEFGKEMKSGKNQTGGRRRPRQDMKRRFYPLEAVACALVAMSLFSCSRAIMSRTLMDTGVDQDIMAARLRIYNQVIQALAIQTARGLQQGVITPVPQLPFSGNNTISEVVIVDARTVELQGFRFREFYLPPGVVIPTTEPQVILSYQSYLPSNAPVNPPPGYALESQLVTLYAFPISALANAGAQPIIITQPVGTPITVTFAAIIPGSVCATFNSSGNIILVPTANAATTTVCDGAAIGTFTLATPPALPPAVAPVASPPSMAPSPAQGPATTLPPGATSPPGAVLPPAAKNPPPPPSPPPSPSSNTGLIVGLCVGLGLPILICLAIGLWYAWRAYSRKQLERMEKESDKRASLETAIVGGSRAPAAGALRTRPYLESEELSADRI